MEERVIDKIYDQRISAKDDENKLKIPFTKSSNDISFVEVDKCTAIGTYLSDIGQKLNVGYSEEKINNNGRIDIKFPQIMSEMVKTQTKTYTVVHATCCSVSKRVLKYMEQCIKMVSFI